MKKYILISTLLLSASLFAQDNSAFTVPLLTSEPTLDDFNEMQPSTNLARSMVMVTNFIQREPNDGSASSQKTEVYVGYDEDNFYAVFLAFDDPSLVRANLAARENIWNDDKVGLLIDTFNDQVSGYAFRSSPMGVQWDGRWLEVSKSPGFDDSYDAVWYNDGRLTDQGYQVIFTIPMKTLRFPDVPVQDWRIQFEREVRRNSENSYWPRYTSDIQGRLNQAGLATGITGVSPGRNVLLIPFLFSREYTVFDESAVTYSDNSETELGLDAKFVFRDSLVLDATYNPDFSQVESDDAQVTVNQRFEVRYDERRPFFQENVDFFATEAALINTRKIVDPQRGLKFTGRQGNWGIGAMLIDDEAPGQRLAAGNAMANEPADITILRAFKDFGEQSRVGMLYSNRKFGNIENSVYSIDSRYKLNDNWTTDIQLVSTESFDSSSDKTTGVQRNLRFDRSGTGLNIHAHYLATTEGFKTDLGYMNRNYSPDTDGGHIRATYTFWPEDGALNQWRPGVFLTHIDDQDGLRIFDEFRPSIEFEWDGQIEFDMQASVIKERLRPQDFSGLNENKDFERKTWSTGFGSDLSHIFGYEIAYESGTDINLKPPVGEEPVLADISQIQLELDWRPTDQLFASTELLNLQYTDQASGARIFDNQIIRSRWSYQYSKELTFRFIAQSEDIKPGSSTLTRLERDRNVNYDFMVRYVINPWSAFSMGYNTNATNFEIIETENGNELVDSSRLTEDGKQFFVKFSYLFLP
jgi:hypothetical protein